MKITLVVLIFLFGTTFWWMSSFMTGQTEAPRHWTWTLTNVLVVLSIIGCSATAWAVLQLHGWWSGAALASGVLGLLAVVTFILAQRTLDIGLGDFGVQINVWLHVVGGVALLGIAVLPAVRHWIAELS